MANAIEFLLIGKDKLSPVLGAANKGLVDFAKVGAAALTGLAGGLVAVAKVQMNVIDANAKMADSFGLPMQQMGGLQHAASLAGISVEGLNTSLRTSTKTISEAAIGTGAAAKSINELGLSASELNKQSPDQQMRSIADALNGVANQSDRARIAMTIFGEQGASMTNMLKGGSAALNAAQKEAEAFGLAISRTDAAMVEAANDEFTRVQAAITGAGRAIAIHLAPYLGAAARAFADVAKENNGFRDELKKTVEIIVASASWIAKAWHGIKTTFTIVADGVIMVLNNMVAKVASAIAWALDKMSILPGVDFSATVASLEQFASTAESVVGLARDNIHESLMAPVPGTGWSDALNKITEDAKAAAAVIAAEAEKAQQLVMGPSQAQIEANRLAGVEFEAETLKRYETLSESLLTERELLLMNYETARMDLENALMNELISEQTHKEMQLQLETQHQASLGSVYHQGLLQRQKFTVMSWDEQTKHVLSSMSQMVQGVAGGSKTMFNIGKGLGIAEAIINTYRGVAQALGAYPPPLSIAMAGLQLATGMAQVSAIKSQSFSGQAHAGLTNVPREGTYLLQQGERVIPPEQNRDLSAFLDGGSGGGGTVINNLVIHVLENATSAGALLDMDHKDVEELVARKFIPALNNLGKIGVKPNYIERLEQR